MNNKKEFISKTLTFIANSIFINLFAKFFGMDNTMVAVSIVVVALTLAAIDMKQDLLKRSLLVTFLMLVIALGATLANTNPFLGLILNFTIILGIIHQLFDHYKGSYYFPFLISYIFLLMSSPASLDQLPRRIISVIFGCIYVILIQLVFNRNRYKKTMETVETVVIEDLINQIDALQNGEKKENLYHKVNHMMPVLTKAIYDNKIQGHYLSNSNKGYVKLVILLDNLNQTLYHIDLKTSAKENLDFFLVSMKNLLQLTKAYINSPAEKQQPLLAQIDEMIRDLKDCELSDELSAYIHELQSLSSVLSSFTMNRHEPVMKRTSILKHKWRSYDFDSYNFKFALKLAVSVSLVIFLVDICHITYGRWIIFPMIAVIQPYYDNTFKKAKHRVEGTLIGLLLFTILFSLVKDPTLRLNLTILTAYVGVFVTKYQYSTALVAISALGSSALRGGGIEILLYRLIFTIVGCAIAMLINRFVFHYKESHIQEDLQLEFNKIKAQLASLPQIQETEARRYHLLLDQKLIEYKLRTLQS